MSGNPDMDGGAVAEIVRNVAFIVAGGDRQMYAYEASRQRGRQREKSRQKPGHGTFERAIDRLVGPFRSDLNRAHLEAGLPLSCH